MTTKSNYYYYRLRALAALVALLVASGSLAGPAEAAFSGDNGKIAFVSRRDNNFEVYSMDASGANQTNLTKSATPDFEPAYSPNGQKISFTSLRLGNYGIHAMNPDGSSPKRLTSTATSDVSSDWAVRSL